VPRSATGLGALALLIAAGTMEEHPLDMVGQKMKATQTFYGTENTLTTSPLF
jgi:hypothetical protein